MLVTTQLKHILVILSSYGKSDAKRISYLLDFTPVKAERASSMCNDLLCLALKLRIITKSGSLFFPSFKIENNNSSSFSDSEKQLLIKQILQSDILTELAQKKTKEGTFLYENNNLVHRLLFELGLIYKIKKNYYAGPRLDKEIKNREIKIVYNDDEHDEIGKYAEKIIYQQEYQKLSEYEKYISKLDHVSLTNDAAGYDILSFDPIGKKQVFIEVKGTKMKKADFFLTLNEFETLQRKKKQYKIMVVYGIDIENNTHDGVETIINPYIYLPKKYDIRSVLYRVSKK